MKNNTTPNQTPVELKALAYDMIVEIEKHQLAIQEIQQKLVEINEQIRQNLT